MGSRTFTPEEALTIGARIGIAWERGDIDVDQFRLGLALELHATQDPASDTPGDNEYLTGRIALGHLREIPDYYSLLADLERDAQT
ncbi:MAG: hypothetical protein NVSMB32_05460 [Actinomycetota bacterium]